MYVRENGRKYSMTVGMVLKVRGEGEPLLRERASSHAIYIDIQQHTEYSSGSTSKKFLNDEAKATRILEMHIAGHVTTPTYYVTVVPQSSHVC
jgi:hypothetical protein